MVPESEEDNSEEESDAEANTEVSEEQEATDEVEESEPASQDYESMTVAELKELLRAAGKPVSGKKADLIARLQVYY